MKIWVDADGCPTVVRDILYRNAVRRQVATVFVANRVTETPRSEWLTSIVVAHGADVADDWITEQVGAQDLVITADIPLAARVVEQGATGIDFRGDLYTRANVRERLSIRDFMADLRESGVQTGGASPFGLRERQSFANALDRLLTRRARQDEKPSSG